MMTTFVQVSRGFNLRCGESLSLLEINLALVFRPFLLGVSMHHQKFQVPKMQGFLSLIFGYFGAGVSLT